MESFYKNYIKNNFNILDKVNVLKVDKLFKNLKNIKKKNKKVLIFGNGAGASIASHFANDLTNSAKIRCLSFDSSTQLTCYANDFGYDNWVKEAIKNFFEKNDLVILISASGNSANMIQAAKFCKKNKIQFFSLTGFKKNNKLNKNSNEYIWVDSKSYNQVEISQLLILLFLVDHLKKNK
jgi:D-sedoheptulose 7-phosphate isomerase|tara:strand:+ start:369 stop:908 length:540 start_codon:yes stop_codon:yes gene_type:complete